MSHFLRAEEQGRGTFCESSGKGIKHIRAALCDRQLISAIAISHTRKGDGFPAATPKLPLIGRDSSVRHAEETLLTKKWVTPCVIWSRALGLIIQAAQRYNNLCRRKYGVATGAAPVASLISCRSHAATTRHFALLGGAQPDIGWRVTTWACVLTQPLKKFTTKKLQKFRPQQK